MSYKTTVYWAERALVPMKHFTPMTVKVFSHKISVGQVHGHTVCVGNFESAEHKRVTDHAKESAKLPDKLPIWC